MTCPANNTVTVVELLSIVIDGFCCIGIDKSSVASGDSFELAVTWLVTWPPWSMSDWVTVYCALQVVVAPGASVALPQLRCESALRSRKLMPVWVK